MNYLYFRRFYRDFQGFTVIFSQYILGSKESNIFSRINACTH